MSTKVGQKLILFVLFCMVFALRWVSWDSPLPATWTTESEIRFTVRLLEEPEHTDSQTIIKRGLWSIKVKGYQDFTPGKTYQFVGTITPQVLLGKIVKIEMMNPTFAIVGANDNLPVRFADRVVLSIGKWRQVMVGRLQKSLPEPHASLSAGILLGVKAAMPYEFYQALVKTGTMHIIAASGYNITIVARVVMVPLLLFVSRAWSVGLAIVGIVIYVILAGGSASIIRAAIMGSLTLVAYYWGRPTEVKRLLWITVAIMLTVNPLMLIDIGFELSVAATAGLIYLEPWIKKLIKIRNSKLGNIQAYLAESLYPTLAATISTLPIILMWFGRMSLISPIVNMLILPVVPVIMGLSAASVALEWVPVVGKVINLLLYVPLWWMVGVIRIFG